MSTIGKRSLKERGLPLTEAGPDHPIYKRGLIIGGVSTSPSSTSGSDDKKVPREEPSVSQEELDRQFQEMLKEHAEGMRESALHQWKGSPSDDTEDSGEG